MIFMDGYSVFEPGTSSFDGVMNFENDAHSELNANIVFLKAPAVAMAALPACAAKSNHQESARPLFGRSATPRALCRLTKFSGIKVADLVNGGFIGVRDTELLQVCAPPR